MKSRADRTHDISLINYHVKDLQSFGERVTEAAAAAFPNSFEHEDGLYGRAKCRYKRVHVLLLSWEADLGVAKEIAELQDTFDNIYHYEVEHWKIPSNRSHNSLNRRLTNFIDDYEGEDTLLIVYYGGHGYMNDDRQCIWSCTRALDAPEVQWYGLQTNIEQADCDVLILLDCCASASSSTTGTGSGITELIAACGFETVAPGVGEHSFTRSLIDELKWWTYGPPLTAAMLHNKVLSRVKYWKPRFGAAPYDERRRTPMYIVLANESKKRSIEIVPLPPRTGAVTEPPLPFGDGVDSTSSSSSSPLPVLSNYASSSTSNTSTEPTAFEEYANSSESSISQVWPDRDFKCPKVLISVALEEDQWLEAESWADWLKKVPAKVKYANVEGIYKSDSTIVLLSIAVAVWDLISDDPAVKFLGFVRSHNLVQYDSCVPSSKPDWSLTTAKVPDPKTLILDLSVSIPTAYYIGRQDAQFSGLEKAVLSEVVMSLIRLRSPPQSIAWTRFVEQPPEYTETSDPPLPSTEIPPWSSATTVKQYTLDTRQMEYGKGEEAEMKLKNLANIPDAPLCETLPNRSYEAGFPEPTKPEWKPELYQLATYTTVFMVDESTFERDLWGETRAALVQCMKRLVAVPNVHLRFRNSLLDSDRSMNSATPNYDISQMVEPQGPTYTYRRIMDHWGKLKKALAVLDPEVRNDHPGLNIIIFIGRPLQEDFETLESLITEISISLDLLMVDENKVGLQFVQIGSDESVARFIKRLLEVRARHGFRRDILDATMFNPDEDTYSEILLGAVNEDMKAARAAMRYHITRHDNPELVLGSDLDFLLGHFPNTISTIYPYSVTKSNRMRARAPHKNPGQIIPLRQHSLSPPAHIHRNPSSTQLNLRNLSMDSTATAQPQNAPHEPSYHSLSLSELQGNYQALYHELKGSDVYYKMYHIFNDKLNLLPKIEITNCVCLGLGSFTGVEGQRLSAEDVANREDSLHQLVILTMILDPDLLGAKHTVRNSWFQEPGLSQTDEVFLNGLGFSTLQFPTALEKITSTTFVFAPRVPYYLTVGVFTACHPALYIGNRLDYLVQQLSVTVEKHSLDPLHLMVLATLTRFKDASWLVPLPVLSHSPFSWTRVTGVHWLRNKGEGEAPGEHGEQEEGLKCDITNSHDVYLDAVIKAGQCEDEGYQGCS